MLDVFKIFISEIFVFEDKIIACFFLDDFAEAVEVGVVEVTIKNIQMNFLAKSHNLLYILKTRIIFLWIRLSHQKHLIVLSPTLLKIAIFLNDGVDNI